MAQALIREQGDAGFSMAQLAARAGVSPATPYNVLGTKSEVLRLVVREEFDNFEGRLEAAQSTSPLARLLVATALVVTHYEADRPFYRGLYRAALSVEAGEMRDLMSAAGRSLWQALVADAVESGELVASVVAQPLTDLLLLTIAATTQAWLAEGWTHERFALSMAGAVRLMLASVANAPWRDRLVQDALAAHADLVRLSDADRAARRAG